MGAKTLSNRTNISSMTEIAGVGVIYSLVLSVVFTATAFS
jgi:hypothetical protein